MLSENGAWSQDLLQRKELDSVQLGRNMFSIIMVTYLPTILMNIINQVINYVTDADKYGLVITVNITCMMVLASVYLSVSGSLPTTAAIKPVEIWLLFNLAYPFLVYIINILLQVKYIIEVLYDRSTDRDLLVPIHES